MSNVSDIRSIDHVYLEDDVEHFYMEDHKVKRHGERDGADEVHVLPRGHSQHGLVLGNAVQRVQHLDHDQHRQRHRHRLRRVEHGLAVNACREGIEKQN